MTEMPMSLPRSALVLALSLASPLASAVARAKAHADGQWTMPSKDYAATRFSGLAQITPATVKSLHPVWSFSTGTLGGHEGQPLVVNNTMYVVTPYPNVLYAFDLTKDGYPLKWKYRPNVDQNAIGIACCDVVNRGAVYAGGKIVYNLLDGHTVAVDAASGKELWNTKIADLAQGETTPMAPLVVKDRVLVGASGGEFGILGWMKGLDLATGKIMWTATNIGPDSLVLAKAGTFKAFYDKGAQLGQTTWPADAWKHGGAPVWGWLTYDPELDLVYYGVGNPGPYNADQRTRRQQVDGERARAAPRRWLARVGVSVHAARHVGLRCGRRDGARRSRGEGEDAQGARALRQERLRVHDGSRHR